VANIIQREGVQAIPHDSTLPEAMQWVKDAPLFIDEENLSRFYDAVVRPAFKEHTPFKLKISDEKKKDLEAKLGFKGKTASWVSMLGIDLEASGEGRRSWGSSNKSEREMTFEPISTPQRQLVQLIAFYLINQPDRLLLGGIDAPLKWQASGASLAVPRALVFIDFPPKTKIIPMAAEFANGKVVKIFEELLGPNGEKPPAAFHHANKHEYWGWFANHFDAGRSVEAIEKASGGNSKIEWIDFRVPLNEKADTMHLHLEARGRYFTGAFAYMAVKRSVSHGLRLVGTLKDGPDINVLALYEK
jgi:hypothetical protein